MRLWELRNYCKGDTNEMVCPLLSVCQNVVIFLVASRGLNDSSMGFIVCLNRRKQLFPDVEFTTIIIILRLGYHSDLCMKVFTVCRVLNCLRWVTIGDVMGDGCLGQSKSILYNFRCPSVYFQVLSNELVYNSLVIFHFGYVRDQLPLCLQDQYQRFF